MLGGGGLDPVKQCRHTRLIFPSKGIMVIKSLYDALQEMISG
jgi:hypothetical protein